MAKRVSSKTSRSSTKSAKKASTSKRSPRKKAKSPKKKSSKKAAEAGDEEVTLDRRRSNRREKGASEEAEQGSQTPAKKLQRRKKVNRRRQIDPTTCERDYSDEEVEFMNALDDYKRTSGRMFPTCSEVLEVIRGLGYTKLSSAEMAANKSTDVLEMDESEEEVAEFATAGAGEEF